MPLLACPFSGAYARTGISRPASLDGTVASRAAGRYTGTGSGVSPVSRICRYFAAPTSCHRGPLAVMSSRRVLVFLVSSLTLLGRNLLASSMKSLVIGISGRICGSSEGLVWCRIRSRVGGLCLSANCAGPPGAISAIWRADGSASRESRRRRHISLARVPVGAVGCRLQPSENRGRGRHLGRKMGHSVLVLPRTAMRLRMARSSARNPCMSNSSTQRGNTQRM